MRVTLLLALAALAAGCPAPSSPHDAGPPPERFCPGGPGCELGNDGGFTAGIAAVDVSPRAWERPRPDFLEEVGGICPEGSPLGTDGQPRCGALLADAWKDCGLDTLCPGATGYVAADADGSEKDGKLDWFLDCGLDGKCPGDVGYAGPDADGTEGDGTFQGFWLAGYGNNIPMYDVHDAQWARAVVMTNGDITIAMVSIDSVGIFFDDVQRIRSRVAKKMPSPPDYVLVQSTHSHEQPDTMGQWGPRPVFLPQRGVDDTWFDEVLIEGAAQAIVDAATSAKPARVFSAVGHIGTRTREVLRDSRDPQVLDDTVTVLRFVEKASGDVIGSIVNWGNHPESLADVNNRSSADFAWALRDAMERGVMNAQGQLLAPGVGGTCVYMQGAVGGLMNPLRVTPTSVDGDKPRQYSFAKAKAIGDIVALTALDALNQAEEVVPNLAYGAMSLRLPVENTQFQLVFINFDILRRRLYDFDRMKVISETNFPHLASELAKVQLGHVRFLAVPGELFPELAIGFDPAFAFGQPLVRADNPNPPDLTKAPAGPYLKEQLGGEVNVILGLANDELGYLVPPYDYKLHPTAPYDERPPGDHYEETNSVGPSTVPRMLEASKVLFGWEPAP